MKAIPNKRTTQDILHYIKMHASEGKLKESMMTIAEGTGYSNATVHRSIRSLQEKGWIQVIPSKKHRMPNIIYYLGPEVDEVYDIIERAEIAVRQLHEAHQEAESVIKDMKEIVRLSLPEEQDLIDLH